MDELELEIEHGFKTADKYLSENLMTPDDAIQVLIYSKYITQVCLKAMKAAGTNQRQIDEISREVDSAVKRKVEFITTEF
ncbi:MAG: hypothetical protein LBE57_04800 [Methanosarcinales archaeon]|jgi:hypothetical protein|nr:hypothetical protein [Methanosarcinales archaeon]